MDTRGTKKRHKKSILRSQNASPRGCKNGSPQGPKCEAKETENGSPKGSKCEPKLGSLCETVLGAHAMPLLTILCISPPGEPKTSSLYETVLVSRFVPPGLLLPPPLGLLLGPPLCHFCSPPPASLLGGQPWPLFLQEAACLGPGCLHAKPPTEPSTFEHTSQPLVPCCLVALPWVVLRNFLVWIRKSAIKGGLHMTNKQTQTVQ